MLLFGLPRTCFQVFEPATTSGLSAAPLERGGFAGIKPNDEATQQIGAPRDLSFATPVVDFHVEDNQVLLTSGGKTRNWEEMSALRKKNHWSSIPDPLRPETLANGLELSNLGISVAIVVEIQGKDYLLLTPQFNKTAPGFQFEYWRLSGGYINQGNCPLHEAIQLQVLEETDDEIVATDSDGVIVAPFDMTPCQEVPKAIFQALPYPVCIDGTLIPGAAVYLDPKYCSAQIVVALRIDAAQLTGRTLHFAEEKQEGSTLQPYFHRENIRLVPLDAEGRFARTGEDCLPSYKWIAGQLVPAEALSKSQLSPSFQERKK